MEEGLANPRRKSMVGPPAKGGPLMIGRKSFAVTNLYQGKGVKSKIDDVTLSNAVSDNKSQVEEQVIDGPINILGATTTTKDLLSISYTEDKNMIAAGFSEGTVRLFDGETHDLVQELCDQETAASRSPITGIKYRPINKGRPQTDSITCTHANGCIKNWNYNFQQCIYTIREKRQTFGITYHTRLPKFVTYGDDARIYLYDEETKTQERIFGCSDAPDVMDGHTSRIFAASFNPRSNHEFISGGWDDTIQFWDIRLPRSPRHISGPHICGESIEVNKTGTEVLTCSWSRENQIQRWDYGSGKLISVVEPDIYQSSLYCGRFFGKDYIICGGTAPNIFRLIDIRTQSTLCNIHGLPGGVYSLDIGIPRKNRKKKSQAFESSLPRVIFAASKTLYEVDFG